MVKNMVYAEEGNTNKNRAPKGHFVVYVGEKLTRFIVPVAYLKNPAFRQLLDKAAEEYGHRSPMGILRLPGDESAFQRVVDSIAK